MTVSLLVVSVFVVCAVSGSIVSAGSKHTKESDETWPPAPRCDILIAGGSTAALAAAITAAEILASRSRPAATVQQHGNAAGSTVCLTEPTDWPGGQMTSSGVSAIDFGTYNRNAVNQPRSFRELVAFLNGAADTRAPGCWVSETCYSPQEMVAGWVSERLANLSNHLVVLDHTCVRSASTTQVTNSDGTTLGDHVQALHRSTTAATVAVAANVHTTEHPPNDSCCTCVRGGRGTACSALCASHGAQCQSCINNGGGMACADKACDCAGPAPLSPSPSAPPIPAPTPTPTPTPKQSVRVSSVQLVQRRAKAGVDEWDTLLSEDLVDWYSPTPSPRFDKRVLNVSDAAVFVDATEFGDLLMTAGLVVGQGVERPTETSAPGSDDQCGQAATTTFFMQLLAEQPAQPDPAPPGSTAGGEPFSTSGCCCPQPSTTQSSSSISSSPSSASASDDASHVATTTINNNSKKKKKNNNNSSSLATTTGFGAEAGPCDYRGIWSYRRAVAGGSPHDPSPGFLDVVPGDVSQQNWGNPSGNDLDNGFVLALARACVLALGRVCSCVCVGACASP